MTKQWTYVAERFKLCWTKLVSDKYYLNSVQEISHFFVCLHRMHSTSNIQSQFLPLKESKQDVFNITSALKRPEAKDDFQFSTNLLELHKTSLAHPLTHPMNLCPSHRQLFPLAWEGATVTPVFKSGDNTDPSNYRPLASSRWSLRSQRNGWLNYWQNIWTQAVCHLIGCSMVFMATTEKWDGCFCFHFSFYACLISWRASLQGWNLTCQTENSGEEHCSFAQIIMKQ